MKIEIDETELTQLEYEANKNNPKYYIAQIQEGRKVFYKYHNYDAQYFQYKNDYKVLEGDKIRVISLSQLEKEINGCIHLKCLFELCNKDYELSHKPKIWVE